MAVRFEVVARCPHTNARTGILHTPHGPVRTPAFMPVGTQGSVKTVSSEDLERIGFEMVLSNTVHLALRPGEDVIHRLGGLHNFMGWRGPILTDSGGYQVMSLSKTRKMTEEAVEFKSQLDGRNFVLSPERSIQIQAALGVDISMALDECPPYPCSREEAASAMERTHRWAKRSLLAAAEGQAVFGIVQGGVHEDLREESLQTITSMPFEGYAIGGVSVGEPTELQRPVVARFAPKMPENKARYLMGVGHPQDIVHAIASGIDLFDCVLPTRMARHHALYTMQGRVNILNSKWAEHDGPFDAESVFPETERYSAAYIRHLFKAGEPLGPRLATLHNLRFYQRLLAEARASIESGGWDAFVERFATA